MNAGDADVVHALDGIAQQLRRDRGFFGDERIVDVHVRRLRTKIERDPSNPRLLVTARGLGYRLDVRS